MKAIGPPVRLVHGLGDSATRLLVEEWHAVRKTQKTNRLVLPRDQLFDSACILHFLFAHMAACVDFNVRLAGTAKCDADFYLEGITAVCCGGPRGNGVKICLQFLVQPFEKLRLSDRNNAISPRCLDTRVLNGVMQRGRLRVSDVCWELCGKLGDGVKKAA